VTPHLDHDDGLEAGGRAQRAHEAARVADALDVEQDALGLRVIGEVVEDFAEIQIGRRAGGNHAGKADAVGLRPVQHGGTQRTGLRHQREVAGQRRTLAEGGIEADGGPLDAQAVGADEADAVFPGHRLHALFQRHALLAHLAKAGGQNDGMVDAALAAFLHDPRHSRRRGGDQRQFRDSRQVAGRGVAAFAKNQLVLGVDGIDLALVAGFPQVPEQDSCDRVLALAGAEDRNRAGVEQGMKIVLGHDSISGVLQVRTVSATSSGHGAPYPTCYARPCYSAIAPGV